MKLLKTLFSSFFIFFLLSIPNFVFAEVSSVDNGYPEKITSFGVQIIINKDRSLDVVETIEYDFGNNQKHGIYRYIPKYYGGRLGSPYLGISKLKITDDSGFSYQKNVEEDLKTYTVRIGSEDYLVSGRRIYNISYHVKNGISVYKDRADFYWNAIGNGWDIPIENIEINISGESNIISNGDFKCFYGNIGSNVMCEKTDSQSNDITYKVENIYVNQAVSVKSEFKKEVFLGLSKFEIFLWETMWYLFVPILILISYFIIWFKFGRDPKKSGATVVQYSPPKGMTPMIAGIVSKPLTAAQKYLPAEIIELATKGYLKIKQIEKEGLIKIGNDYELIKLKNSDKSLLNYQKYILDSFFLGRERVKISELKTDTNFGMNIKDVPIKARRLARENDFFKFSPIAALTISLVFSTIIIAFNIFIFTYFESDPRTWPILILSMITSIFFAFLMPKRSMIGLKTYEYLSGLKIYINYAEKDRIKFLNAPKKTPEKFEELLPYAMVFGLEKEWSKQFEGIYKQPTWYEGNFVNGFTVGALTHDLGGFSNVATSSVTSYSGGGGAGGGAGGGGGGSW